MSPEQIQKLVEQAIAQKPDFPLSYFLLVAGISLLAGALGKGLMSYFSERGKNQATKADIGHLTNVVEKLKTSWENKSYFSKTRYEREFAIYQAVWPSLEEFRGAAASLRPFLDTSPKDDEEREARDNERITRYIEAEKEFVRKFLDSRPFFPAEIFKELDALCNLCRGEALEFRFPDRNDQEPYKKALANATAIAAQVDKICNIIRDRLAKFED